MSREFCSGCGVVRNLAVTTVERTETDEDGKVRKVITRTYHCESCGLFVRSSLTTPGGPE